MVLNVVALPLESEDEARAHYSLLLHCHLVLTAKPIIEWDSDNHEIYACSSYYDVHVATSI